jgi:hypothetical protein
MSIVAHERAVQPEAAKHLVSPGTSSRGGVLRADLSALKPTLLVVGALVAAVAIAIVVGLVAWSPRSAGDVAVSATDYRFAMPTTLAAGHHTIAFTNNGKQPHEFLLFRTDLSSHSLPVDADGRVVEESPLLQNVVDSGNGLEVGGTQSLPVTLDPGHYVAVCNLANHYKLGMALDLTVE